MQTAKYDYLTPVEAGLLAGVSVRAVYKALRDRVPRSEIRRQGAQLMLTEMGALCLKLDRELPRGLPGGMRRRLIGKARSARGARLIESQGVLRYVVDLGALRRDFVRDLGRHRAALALIVRDPAVQAGEPVFRGTRVLARQIADLLAAGESEARILEDYPKLTPAMIEAAGIYRASHPARGRPRAPTWRKTA